ncbi:ceramidase-domain-containing protein [Radiomyces spectabilis]|uniref:ceramidase-domain-containing protein n=1 Tax=Radiomyces spectabilis TaxID=64574 RepID=UPI00221F75E4|nr:ceramidase-domain-containing protein [Radiomyces spectabilis]KAI8364157.1 ceramidase-domain-containing protein [Radiomyces spectabilis]
MTNNLLDVEPVGYWGPITSSVDWCEKNYTHWYYVAEWWNTLSSLAMIVLGLLGVGSIIDRSVGGYRVLTSSSLSSVLAEHGYERHLYGICIACYCGLATYVTSQSKGTTQFYMFQTSWHVLMSISLHYFLLHVDTRPSKPEVNAVESVIL